MTNTKFEVGDTVYIPQQDPKADTIWEITKITKSGNFYLFHPVKGKEIVGEDEIEYSPF